MSDRPANGSGNAEPVSADIDAATRRLMAALDALESAVERRREADRDENELASRIQALGADRSRLADELDGSLVKSRRLERTNREIAERLDAAIGTIRSVLDAGETHEPHQRHHQRPAIPDGLRGRAGGAAAEARREPGNADRNLRGKFGEIGDARLTVMAALTVCDELLDASRAHPHPRRGTRRPAQRPRRGGRSRQGDADRGRQRAERRRRPHREDHAGAEPHHRRRRRDWLTIPALALAVSGQS
jgi:cell division protein ZapA (FtsZ GTPase activity inhibitor)